MDTDKYQQKTILIVDPTTGQQIQMQVMQDGTLVRQEIQQVGEIGQPVTQLGIDALNTVVANLNGQLQHRREFRLEMHEERDGQKVSKHAVLESQENSELEHQRYQNQEFKNLAIVFGVLGLLLFLAVVVVLMNN